MLFVSNDGSDAIILNDGCTKDQLQNSHRNGKLLSSCLLAGLPFLFEIWMQVIG